MQDMVRTRLFTLERLIVLILISIGLYGQSFSITLKPGLNYTNIPAALIGPGHKITSPCIGLQASIQINPVFSIDLSSSYNPRTWNSDYYGFSDVSLNELYVGCAGRFNIPMATVSPYFALGLTRKYGSYDFLSFDETSLNLTFAHGYKIKISSHFAIVPETLLYLQLQPETDIHGLSFSLGFSYDNI